MPNGALPASHWERRLNELKEEIYPSLRKTDVLDRYIEDAKDAARKCDFRLAVLSLSSMVNAMETEKAFSGMLRMPKYITFRDTVFKLVETLLNERCGCGLR